MLEHHILILFTSGIFHFIDIIKCIDTSRQYFLKKGKIVVFVLKVTLYQKWILFRNN